MSEEQNLSTGTDSDLYAELQQELDQTKAELDQANNQMLRAMADLQNLKKRQEQERIEMSKYASFRFIEKLLPIMDNWDRAISHIPAELIDNEWVKGVMQIQKQLTEACEKEGLTAIAAEINAEFDPNLHEAVMTDENFSANTIAKCLEKGYTLHDRVIRAAKVSVGNQ